METTKFKVWLENNPTQKAKLTNWEEFFSLVEEHKNNSEGLWVIYPEFTPFLEHLRLYSECHIEGGIEERDKKLFTSVLEYHQSSQKSTLLNQKIEGLETSLLNLAKQKIKGKKDAEKAVIILENQFKTSLQEKETNWNRAKEKLTTNLTNTQTELNTTKLELTQTNQELTQVKQTNQTLQNSLTNQQTTNQTLQTHYGTRKNQALFIGIIGLIIILYLAWPSRKVEVKEEPKTWTYV